VTKYAFIFAAGLLIGAATMLVPPLASYVRAAVKAVHSAGGSAQGAGESTHTERTFEFTVKLPMEAAAPLFGADQERKWAPGWSPVFLWPAPAKDQQGMVFTVAHGEKKSVWIAPKFDLATGSVQYAYVIPDVMVTLITLKITPQDKWTHVAVQYDRTALNPAAKDVVLEMADQDSKAGPEWEKQISDYVNTLPK
jgi:hypothetical protein